MTLKDYLIAEKQSFAEFGAKFDPRVSEHTVKKWARHERFPRIEALRKIAEITDGKVTSNDFAASEAAA